jgi:hypothetical protein
MKTGYESGYDSMFYVLCFMSSPISERTHFVEQVCAHLSTNSPSQERFDPLQKLTWIQ